MLAAELDSRRQRAAVRDSVGQVEVSLPAGVDGSRDDRGGFFSRRGWQRRRPRSAGGQSQNRSPRGDRLVLRARLVSAALWGFVSLAPVGVVVSWMAYTRPMPVPPEPEPVTVRADAGIGGYAENYLAVFLTATSTDLERVQQFFPGAKSLPRQSPDLIVDRTALVGLDAVSETGWEALVSADVFIDLPDDELGYLDFGTRYYRIDVVSAPNGLAAASLPAQVSAPSTLNIANAYDQLQGTSGDLAEVGEALHGFFTAYLAGDGQLERYVATDARIVPITPAPFTSITIDGLALHELEPNRWEIHVQVTGAAADFQTTYHYSLIAKSDPRWEISDIS